MAVRCLHLKITRTMKKAQIIIDVYHFFSKEVSNPIKNLFSYDKVGVPHQKQGI